MSVTLLGVLSIARVHFVYTMNADSATNPHTKPTNLGCELSFRLQPSTHTVAIY